MEPEPESTVPAATPPGAARDQSWLWLLAGGVVVLLVTVLGGVRLVTGPHAGRSTDGPSTTTPSSSTNAVPVAASEPAAQVRCWDGTRESSADDCSLPAGAEGLAWVFPRLAQELCGAPSSSGSGVVIGVVCTTNLSDGSQVQVGYLQWESVQDGVDFYAGQGLTSSDGAGLRGWTGTAGGTFTSALMYTDLPFSETLILPASASVSSEDIQTLAPRPADEVRGVPVG